MAARRGRRALATAAIAAVLLVACSDDGGDDDTVPTTAPPTTIATTTTGADATEQAVIATVTAFAEDVVGMVDPVVGPATVHESEPLQATVEVRSRREGGAEDLSLPATTVELVATDDGWRIVSAAGPNLTIDSPPAGMRLSAGFVTPSGRATAYEGTVVVQALLDDEVLGEAVTTAEGIQDAPWSARVETGVEAEGDGYILAFTTAGTELGAPVFAVVPVTFGAAAAPGDGALPDDPQAYALAAFDAWIAGDGDELARLATPAAVQSLGAGLGGQEWTAPQCEGAAGSTYCTWTSPSATVEIRVGNEAAGTGQEHAVDQARVTPA